MTGATDLALAVAAIVLCGDVVDGFVRMGRVGPAGGWVVFGRCAIELASLFLLVRPAAREAVLTPPPATSAGRVGPA